MMKKSKLPCFLDTISNTSIIFLQLHRKKGKTVFYAQTVGKAFEN